MADTSYKLSTKDNPYNPYTDWDEWYMYDVDHGWNSCEVLARVANTSDSFTEGENDEEIERAIDRIIAIDPLQMYIKVSKEHPQGV